MLVLPEDLHEIGPILANRFQAVGWGATWSADAGGLSIPELPADWFEFSVEVVDPTSSDGWAPFASKPPAPAEWTTADRRPAFLAKLQVERDRTLRRLSSEPERALYSASYAHSEAYLHSDELVETLRLVWKEQLGLLRAQFPAARLFYVRPPDSLLRASVAVRILARLTIDPAGVANMLQTGDSTGLGGSGAVSGRGVSFVSQITPVAMLWAPSAAAFCFEAIPGVLVLDLGTFDVDIRDRRPDLARLALPDLSAPVETGMLAPSKVEVDDFARLLRWWSASLGRWYAESLGRMPTRSAGSNVAIAYQQTVLLSQLIDDVNTLSARGHIASHALESVAYAAFDKMAKVFDVKEHAFLKGAVDRKSPIFTQLRQAFDSIPDTRVRFEIKSWLERSLEQVLAAVPATVSHDAGPYLRERRNLHHGALPDRRSPKRLEFLMAGDPSDRFYGCLAEFARAVGIAVIARGPL